MKIKGAIFDMDGTILDSLMFWEHLWKTVGEIYMGNTDFKPSEKIDKAIRTMIYSDAMKYVKSECEIPTETDSFIRFASDCINDFYRDVAKPKKGAKEMLEHLKAKKVKLYLASATEKKKIKLALERHGLFLYFDGILSCAELGVGKDRPDVYLEALRLMELDASEVCVFEDSFVALETAKKCGFRTVGLYDRYNFEQERLRAASDLYMDESKSLKDLISAIDA